MRTDQTLVRRAWRVLRNMLPFGFLLLVAISITGCDSAKSRAEAEAIRSEAYLRAVATQQALEIEATVAAIKAREDLAMQPDRIRNLKTRERSLNFLLILVLASLTTLGVLLAGGEIKARRIKALNSAQSYRPDPRTGALPVVRVDHAPSRAAHLAHGSAPLIRILRPDYRPEPLHYATMLMDLDSGTQVRLRRVVDERGRLHVWQETHLAPPGQQALVHHTRRVVTVGHAVSKMNQRHVAAGEIAQAVPQVGHMPAFEPSHSGGDGADYIQLGSYQYVEQQTDSENGHRAGWAEKA